MQPPRSHLVSIALASGLAWGGCGPAPLFVEAPEVEGARSFLLALERGAGLEVHATEATEDPLNLALEELPSAEEEPLRVTRVSLSRSLRSLGWPAGRLASSPAPNQPLASVTPIRVDGTELAGDANAARLEPASLSPALGRFLVPRVTVCPSFSGTLLGEFDRVNSVVGTSAGLGVAVARTHVLIAGGPNDLTVVELPEGVRGDAVALSDTGRVWVATSSTIQPFDPVRRSFETPVIPTPSSARTLGFLVNEAGDTLELWLMDGGAGLRRYDARAQTFEVEHQLSGDLLASGFTSTPASFARRPGGGFFAASRDLTVLVEYAPGRPSPFAYPLAAKGFGVVFAPDGERVLAASILPAAIWEHRQGVWSRIFGDKAELAAIAPFGADRLLYATRVGGLGMIDPPGPQCPEQVTPDGVSVRALTRVGQGFLFGGVRPLGGDVLGWLSAQIPVGED